jgi:hypothetical protein
VAIIGDVNLIISTNYIMSCPAIYPAPPTGHCKCKYLDEKKSSVQSSVKTKHNTAFKSNQSRFGFGRNTRGRWNFSLTNTKLHPVISECSGNIIQSGNIFSNTSHSMSKKQRLASLMKRGGKRYRR